MILLEHCILLKVTNLSLTETFGNGAVSKLSTSSLQKWSARDMAFSASSVHHLASMTSYEHFKVYSLI